MTAEEIQVIVTSLEVQLGTGKASVRFGDREIRYNSPSSIERALVYFKSLLADASGTVSRPQIRLYSNSGY